MDTNTFESTSTNDTDSWSEHENTETDTAVDSGETLRSAKRQPLHAVSDGLASLEEGKSGEYGRKGCHLRWSRIAKKVAVKETNSGLLRSSIAAPTIESADALKKQGTTTKVILNEVSGQAAPGKILALMGPSGSGKTSLLDTLAGRSAFDSGEITVDGVLAKGSEMKKLKRKVAYVKQKDIFFDHLTVRDQLTYTALLRLPSTMPKVQKHAEVSRIINLLRLTKCADSPIMLLSGGERKRVNIGTELLTDPNVIILDEPTSGLDSTSAVALMDMLKDLAKRTGTTVITSIHQPSSAVFRSFDQLLMLAEGNVVYFGTPIDSLDYLSEQGFACPDGYNAADHWMDLIVVDSALEPAAGDDGDAAGKAALNKTSSDVPTDARPGQSLTRNASAGRIRRQRRQQGASRHTPRARLIAGWDNEAVASKIELAVGNSDATASHEKPSQDEKKYNTGWLTQCTVLIHRSLKNSRSAIFTPLNIVKSGLIGLTTGLLWFQMDYTESTVSDRSSYFFFTMTYWVFDAMFAALMAFPTEREIIFKERASGSYHLSAYFIAKTTSEAPTRLALPVIYMMVSYWLAGVNNRFVVFFASTCCTMLSVMAGESIGLVIGASVMDFERAMTVMVVVSLALMLAGGYFVRNIPSFLEWLKYLSPFKYAFDASLEIVFDRDVPCDGSGVLEELCRGKSEGSVSPEDVTDFLGAQGSVAFNTCMLFLIFLLPRYVAYAVLKRKRGGERI